jgi:hypothetical protein
MEWMDTVADFEFEIVHEDGDAMLAMLIPIHGHLEHNSW